MRSGREKAPPLEPPGDGAQLSTKAACGLAATTMRLATGRSCASLDGESEPTLDAASAGRTR